MRGFIFLWLSPLLTACASLDAPQTKLQCSGETNLVLKAKVLGLETMGDEGLYVDGELWAAIILKADLQILDVIKGDCIGQGASLRLPVTNTGYLNKGDETYIYLDMPADLDAAPLANWDEDLEN